MSDHHFVVFSLPLKSSTSLPPTPHTVTSHRNLKCCSPSTLTITVLSSLPSPQQLYCPPRKPPPLCYSPSPPPWTPSVPLPPDQCNLFTLPVSCLRLCGAGRTELWAAERKWKRSDCADLSRYLHLLSDFTSTVSAAKSTFYWTQDQLLCLQPQETVFHVLFSPHPSLTAEGLYKLLY